MFWRWLLALLARPMCRTAFALGYHAGWAACRQQRAADIFGAPEAPAPPTARTR